MSETLSISIPDGNFDAYVAYPAQTTAPAVIVIQEIFGINADMRETCDEYARQGYVALCPDLFWRLEPNVELTDRTEAEWQQALKYYNAFDVNTGVEDIAATIGFARGLSQVQGKIGSVGFCLGGLLSFLTAARTDVDASVSYYGGGTDQYLAELPKIKVPLMLHLAEEDEFIPADARNRVLAAVKGQPNVEVYTYPGCHHAFARNQGAHYDAAAAQLANGRTADFFAKHLK
ncbi:MULTISPECIES: dienelactone hydrolase family protein [Caballeronia]|jgi:carboxymethylenebutenolidase|uniref:Carboxymethylenebutenolidase n=1 Tax=Caballeronia zhejiangensis TaxID=871203 RepID=A0A656QI99_9BURK|nr:MULTISPECIES: dienelactone hydrolase family protein [Caballeronia]EKS73211.1 carboxymethylenebutenolidase [Burkholderia sp. SJ98]KDR28707.1 carboxymethylenebutenolidase [Caballeronia zhejiangensis]MCI1046551.1 dienelactone hydrolase family protein [Caballeronia zhejiangensis]MDR5765944.1 dienelactone hydrolase family protein [Caballeronia sp. LZ028]MDR5786667.1 dienelactone hydrolase family protein [Caballeronia sp. LP003]